MDILNDNEFWISKKSSYGYLKLNYNYESELNPKFINILLVFLLEILIQYGKPQLLFC